MKQCSCYPKLQANLTINKVSIPTSQYSIWKTKSGSERDIFKEKIGNVCICHEGLERTGTICISTVNFIQGVTKRMLDFEVLVPLEQAYQVFVMYICIQEDKKISSHQYHYTSTAPNLCLLSCPSNAVKKHYQEEQTMFLISVVQLPQ